MRTQGAEERPTVICATCRFSTYLHADTVLCPKFETPNDIAVPATNVCEKWEGLLVQVGRGQQRFGALCPCPRCSH